MKPPFPPDVDTNPCLKIYGVDISEDLLCEYARLNIPEAKSWGPGNLMIGAILHIKSFTQIDHLLLMTARFDETVPSDLFAWNGEEIPILCICTELPESYNYRPCQAKVDLLARITGKQPRWRTDFNDILG